MDIWGTKAKRLQRELDQANEDLKEAREMISGINKAVEEVVSESKESPNVEAKVSGASILYLQNRRKKTSETLDNG